MQNRTEHEVYVSNAMEWLWGVVLFILMSVSLVPMLEILSAAYAYLSLIGIALAFPAGLFASFATYATLAGLLNALLPPVKEGIFTHDSGDSIKVNWMLHYGINNFVRVFAFQRLLQSNPLLRRLYFTLFGARVHPRAKISYETNFLDPSLVEIGKGTKIGAYTIIAGHYSDNSSFVIGRVRIGINSLIGGEVLIAPGVRIGDDAVIEARSSILPGTVVPSGEVWGGTPARFRRKVCMPENAG